MDRRWFEREARRIAGGREEVVGSLKPPGFLQELRKEALAERYRNRRLITLVVALGAGIAAIQILRRNS